MRFRLWNNFVLPVAFGLVAWGFFAGMSYSNESKDIEERSIASLTRDAEQGVMASQAILGQMYYHGEGVSKDVETSIKWMRQAAEQGDAESQYRLALIIGEEYDTPEMLQLAAFWLECAARRGHVRARVILEHLEGLSGIKDI